MAASPQRAEAPGRRKKPRRRRVEATPPVHPRSWPGCTQAKSARNRVLQVRRCCLVVIHQCCCMLTFPVCSPPASPPRPGRLEMETNPTASAAVTIAMVGTMQEAGVTPPPTTSTPRWAMRVKKVVMKKSTLQVCTLLHSNHLALFDLYDGITKSALLGL
jgi:hypothetical protein